MTDRLVCALLNDYLVIHTIEYPIGLHFSGVPKLTPINFDNIHDIFFE